MMDLAALSEPFHPSAVHWRVQGTPYERDGSYSAMALAYIDARDVMDRLDEACGVDRWQSNFDETPKGRIICRLSIDVTGQGDWVTKSDGAGDTDVEGEKGAMSDALKRAAVSWGIGRYLYRMGSPWVPCEVSNKNGKVYWKSWKVDPWTKVKAPPPKPAVTGASQNLAVQDAQVRIESATDLADLQAVWKSLKPAVQADPAVIKAKDAAKAQLQQKEAA